MLFVFQQNANFLPPRRVGLCKQNRVTSIDGIACVTLGLEIQSVAPIDRNRRSAGIDRLGETTKVPVSCFLLPIRFVIVLVCLLSYMGMKELVGLGNHARRTGKLAGT